MGKGNLDIRIIQLAKWQIPKSGSLSEEEKDTYLAIGYFDMMEIVKVQEIETMHPLSQAYCGLPRHKQTNTSEEYTMQELIIFTDVGGFGLDVIDQFWDDNSLLMYISLIHVDNESDIEQIIKRIQEEFGGKRYLYYFSFDYSGIVLLAKEMKIEDYTASMFRLNYDNKKREKLIRDSFSMFGLNKKKLTVYFAQAKQGYANIEEIPENETFPVVVNIGVQNFNIYNKFIEEVENAKVVIEKCGMLGRHDVSIINNEGDLKWLIYIQYLLDKYTTHQEDADNEKLFSTYETFVKVKIRDMLEDTDGGDQDPYYNIVKDRLDMLCDKFSTSLERKRKYYNGEYEIPIRAVKYSVLSILKNRFAEDFVLCMYSSFCETLSYLTEKMLSNQDDSEAFETCYGEYFRGLNSLVNSAMHSERQFIQATAFNALIYDVPSKIMAFYVAIIHDIQEVIKSCEDKNYTFLLTPSFSNEIYVKVISYPKEELPHDRILMVSINEKSLYNPRGVSRRMAHEVAHYVGDAIRGRQYRKECFELSVIYIILNSILQSAFIETGEFYSLIETIRDTLPNDMRFNQEEMNYSEDLTRVGAQIVEEFIGNQEIIKQLRNYICITIKNIVLEGGDSEREKQLKDYISGIIQLRTGNLENMFGAILKEETWSETETDIMVNLIMGDVKEKINYINCDQGILLRMGEVEQSVALGKPDGILARETIGEFAEMLKSIYSEAFADVQMILLLDFGYEDYLNGFLMDESIDLENLPRIMEDLSRIAMVVLTMNLVGMWDELKRQDYFGNSDHVQLQKLHGIIYRECAAMMLGVEFEDIAEELDVLREAVGRFKRQVEDNVEYEVKEFMKSDIMVEREDVDDRMMNVYVNVHLLQYLIVCTKNSIGQYLEKDKIRMIQKLRKTIGIVTSCRNMRETFKAICTEVKEYRETIFHEGICENVL